jgi:hypothetical protein
MKGGKLSKAVEMCFQVRLRGVVGCVRVYVYTRVRALDTRHAHATGPLFTCVRIH